MAEKKYGRVVRAEPSHIFFLVHKENILEKHVDLGLTQNDIVKAFAKPAKLPAKFEYLLAESNDFVP